MKAILILVAITSLLILPLFAGASSCWDPVRGHCYPRIGIFHWGKAQPEWYSKFQLVVTGNSGTGFVNDIKSINPHTYVLPTKDWQAGAPFYKFRIPNGWKVLNSDGEAVKIYNGMRNLADMTEFCPRLSDHDNMNYDEYLAKNIPDILNIDNFDGISSDGCWVNPQDEARSNIDLDRNGVDDYDEHGQSWVQSRWREGIENAARLMREKMGNDKILIINPGGMQKYYNDDRLAKYVNGIIAEDIVPNNVANFGYYSKIHEHWIENSHKPLVMLFDGQGKKKDDYRAMRFLLGMSMYGDSYFNFYEGFCERCNRHNEHWYKDYYDEFELNLGWPKSAPQIITSRNHNKEGVFVRFFDKGIVIVNAGSVSHTITDQQLRDMFPTYYDSKDPDGDGWDGYYFFRGGQDPSRNNGGRFTEITLLGEKLSYGMKGDAVLLTKEPTTSITDIIIDNMETDTSPGSSSAVFTGGWFNEEDMKNDYEKKIFCINIRAKSWGQVCRGYADLFSLTYSQSQSAQARFNPTINVPGPYEVFEWHGDVEGKDEATNVKYTITYSGGTKIKMINQNENKGQWNSLGVYDFDVGTDEGVTISAEGADGIVIADAVKFVCLCIRTITGT